MHHCLVDIEYFQINSCNLAAVVDDTGEQLALNIVLTYLHIYLLSYLFVWLHAAHLTLIRLINLVIVEDRMQSVSMSFLPPIVQSTEGKPVAWPYMIRWIPDRKIITTFMLALQHW